MKDFNIKTDSDLCKTIVVPWQPGYFLACFATNVVLFIQQTYSVLTLYV